MIISHRHKFIFFHCRKAAGSSITVSLSRYLGSRDIQLGAIVDGAKLGIHPPLRIVLEALPNVPIHTCFNSIFKKTEEIQVWEKISFAAKAKYSHRLGEKPQHASALTVKKIFPNEFANYFKFCVTRNPWDKTVSDYFWKTRKHKNPPRFEEYVESLVRGDSLDGITPRCHNNWDIYATNGEIAVDHVILYENLKVGLFDALDNIPPLKWDTWLPNSKSGNRLNDQKNKQFSYRDYYSPATRRMVGRLYEPEIVRFGYQF
jgi:hypothetical protein